MRVSTVTSQLSEDAHSDFIRFWHSYSQDFQRFAERHAPPGVDPTEVLDKGERYFSARWDRLRQASNPVPFVCRKLKWIAWELQGRAITALQDGVEAGPPGRVEQTVNSRMNGDCLRCCLRVLARSQPKEYAVVVLEFFAGETHEHIADVLDRATRTIGRLKVSALAWLKRCLSGGEPTCRQQCLAGTPEPGS